MYAFLHIEGLGTRLGVDLLTPLGESEWNVEFSNTDIYSYVRGRQPLGSLLTLMIQCQLCCPFPISTLSTNLKRSWLLLSQYQTELWYMNY